MENTIIKAEYKAFLLSMVAALVLLYLIANFTSQATCDNFGLAYQGDTTA